MTVASLQVPVWMARTGLLTARCGPLGMRLTLTITDRGFASSQIHLGPGYLAVKPASTGRVIPVMYRPERPHRYTIASLISVASMSGTGSKHGLVLRHVSQ